MTIATTSSHKKSRDRYITRFQGRKRFVTRDLACLEFLQTIPMMNEENISKFTFQNQGLEEQESIFILEEEENQFSFGKWLYYILSTIFSSLIVRNSKR